jgi:hypothetical protein
MTRPEFVRATASGGRTDDHVDRAVEDGSGWTRERVAAVAFGVYVAAALPFLVWVGAQGWFFHDEWILLAGGWGDSVSDLFRPFNEHWITVPVLAYQGLWSVVGLESYVPYVTIAVVAHLSAAVLLRVVMRRAEVGPWMATVAAATFVLFGPGGDDIVRAFQMTFGLALAFGLGHLLLADHDGPVDRRDWLGLAAGAAALMCSGVGVTMVAVVGLAALLRRGWRPAAFHLVPLAALYGAWYLAEGRPRSPAGWPSASTALSWVYSSETGTFLGIGRYPVLAVALLLVLVAGLALAWYRMPWEVWRRTASASAALLAGQVLLFSSVATSRWQEGDAVARSDRYVHLGAALVLPALAIAAEAVARRWRSLAPVMFGLLLLPIPLNAAEFRSSERHADERAWAEAEQVLLAMAESPELDEVPLTDWSGFGLLAAPPVTNRWLSDARDGGKLPLADPVGPDTRAQARLRLAIAQVGGAPPGQCTTYTEPLDLAPGRGDQFGIEGRVAIAERRPDGTIGPEVVFAPLQFGPIPVDRLAIRLDGLALRISAPQNGERFTFCS